MKAHPVVCLILFSVMAMPATVARAQEREAGEDPASSSLIGKKYTTADHLGMYDFFSAAVGRSHLIEAFTTAPYQFDAKHIHILLVELKEGMQGERTIVDELLFDRETGDSFSYIPIYDRRSDTKKEHLARYFIDNKGEVTLKELYEFDPDTKKIITKPPIPGMEVNLDEL
jgi:hypothetical protein